MMLTRSWTETGTLVRLLRALSAAVVLATLVLAWLASESASRAAEGDRLALIIANAAYPEAGAAAGVGRDAELFRTELARAGFTVTIEADATKARLRAALDTFWSRIRPGTTALIYFNGIGLQSDRQTYLLPVDARIRTEADLRGEGVGLDVILSEMHRRGAAVKIAVVDAARRNPFEARFRTGTAGLAPPESPEGTLVLFAAAPGRTGPDPSGEVSLFMSELTKEMRAPDVGAEDVFKRTRVGVSRASGGDQVPWVSSTLIDDVVLAQPPAEDGAGTPPASAGAQPPAAAAPPPSETTAAQTPPPPPPVAATPAPPPAPSGTVSAGTGGAVLPNAAALLPSSTSPATPPKAATSLPPLPRVGTAAPQPQPQPLPEPTVAPTPPPPAPPPPVVATPAPPPPSPPPTVATTAEPGSAPEPPPSEAQAGGDVAATPGAAGSVFRDCADCPELVVVPPGSFDMGSGTTPYDRPVHRVTIARSFALSRSPITFDDWQRCRDDGGCSFTPDNRGWGAGRRPVISVSWNDTQTYLTWLSRKTGHVYRLPSEAEWEYAARAGTKTAFSWGPNVGARMANCRECLSGAGRQTVPVGSFPPNRFGLFDMGGNVAQWVQDCWSDTYKGAPADGGAAVGGNCTLRGLRGGSFDSLAAYIRPTARFRYDADVRYFANGFRVLRELP